MREDETVRSLSDVGVRIFEGEFSSVREDLEKRTYGFPVVLPRAKAGGKVNSMYALLGKYDIVLITDFPGVTEVMKASVALNKLTNISFTSFPAISIEEFDKIIG